MLGGGGSVAIEGFVLYAGGDYVTCTSMGVCDV